MSNQSLTISIKALVEGLKQVQELGSSMYSAAGGAKSLGDVSRISAPGVGSLVQASSTGVAGISTLWDRLSGAVKRAAAAYAAFLAVSSLADAAKTAARNETLAITLGIVGKNAGYTKDELDRYEKQVRSLGITTEAARGSITQMIQAGLPLGPVMKDGADQVALMARAAQDLAVVMGTDSSETFQRMILNIQQLDTQGLRFMGVVVDLQAANEKYAISIGKTASALTKQEQQQALANATLDKAKGFMGAYEASMETVGKKLSSMTRLQKDASEAIGNILLPAFGVLVDSASNVLKQITKWANAITASGSAAQALKDIANGVVDAFSRIGTIVIGAISPIVSAVQLAASKFIQAFSGLSVGGLVEGFQELVDWVSRFAVSVATVVGEAAPAFRLLFDTAYALVIQLKDAAVALLDFQSAGQSTSLWASALRGVLKGMGFLIAALSDGFSVVQYAAEATFGLLMIGFGAVSKVIGGVIGLFNDNLGQAFKDIGDNALEMGFKAVESSNKIEESMIANGSAIEAYLKKVEKIPAAQEKAAVATEKSVSAQKAAYQGIDEKVTLFTKAVERDGLRGQAAVEQYKVLKAELTKVGGEYSFTSKQVDILTNRLDASRNKAQDASEDLKRLGITVSELKTKTSDTGAQMLQAFNGIVRSAAYTSEQVRAAFSKGLDAETTVRGLTRFKEAAEQAFKDGALSAADYAIALQDVNVKFEELFQKALKSANSKAALDELKEATQQVGAAGAIAGAEMSKALDDIATKAGGASTALVDLAVAATNLEEKRTATARASLDVARSELEVRKANAEVLKAEIAFKNSGSELDKATLANVKAQKEVVEAKLEVSRAHWREESAAMDVLISKQKEANAQKDLSSHAGDASYIAKAESAERESRAAQLVLETTKQTVQEAERKVLITEQEVLRTQEVVDKLKEEGDVQRQNDAGRAAANQQFMGGLAELFGKINNASGAMKELGYSAKEAAAIAEEAKRNAFAAPSPDFGIAIDVLFQEIDKLQAKAVQFKEEMGKAIEFKTNFEEVGAAAEQAERAARGLTHESKLHSAVSSEISKIYAEIEAQAWKIADAAVASADAFKNSAASIHEELLKAQGKEEEVALARYESRKRELAVEYQMLDIKLAVASAQAKAAGISTVDIDNSRTEARAAFERAKADLGELQDLEIKKIKKTKAEQAEKDREAAQALVERQRQETASNIAKAATEAAKNSSSMVVGARGVSGTLTESAQGRATTISNTINVNVDGKDLLSEDQIRRKVIPAIDSISKRSR